MSYSSQITKTLTFPCGEIFFNFAWFSYLRNLRKAKQAPFDKTLLHGREKVKIGAVIQG